MNDDWTFVAVAMGLVLLLFTVLLPMHDWLTARADLARAELALVEARTPSE